MAGTSAALTGPVRGRRVKRGIRRRRPSLRRRSWPRASSRPSRTARIDSFVEQQRRDRKGELADDVGRRQDGGDHEDEHDGVAPLVAQELRRR